VRDSRVGRAPPPRTVCQENKGSVLLTISGPMIPERKYDRRTGLIRGFLWIIGVYKYRQQDKRKKIVRITGKSTDSDDPRLRAPPDDPPPPPEGPERRPALATACPSPLVNPHAIPAHVLPCPRPAHDHCQRPAHDHCPRPAHDHCPRPALPTPCPAHDHCPRPALPTP
jgi:hypothetical protein